jgi:hypothetical protein
LKPPYEGKTPWPLEPIWNMDCTLFKKWESSALAAPRRAGP